MFVIPSMSHEPDKNALVIRYVITGYKCTYSYVIIRLVSDLDLAYIYAADCFTFM